MKKNQKTQENHTVFIIFGALILVWLLALTVFTLWSWNQHIWQAKVDSETIYQLLVENAKQQVILDELQSK